MIVLVYDAFFVLGCTMKLSLCSFFLEKCFESLFEAVGFGYKELNSKTRFNALCGEVHLHGLSSRGAHTEMA